MLTFQLLDAARLWCQHVLATQQKGFAMMNIGQFAYSTGLSVKTLRYYDEIGLLPAADVDEFNGYRSYRASQLRDAALLRVLRTSGMGISQMKRALTHPTEIDELLAQRRAELAAQRELEDWALEEAPHWQDIDLNAVKTRSCAAQTWVGVAVPLDLRDVVDEADGQAAEECFGRVAELSSGLFAELASRGLVDAQDAGEHPSWMELRTEPARPSVIQTVCCIPVDDRIRVDFTIDGHPVMTGELPDRVEAFVTESVAAADSADSERQRPEDRLAGGPLPQRAGIALSLVAEQAGADPFCVRQQTRETADGFELEHSLTLSAGQ